MFPFYLYEQIQLNVSVDIVQDNAKMHKKKWPSRRRREQFTRSRSEPLVTTPEGAAPVRSGGRRNLFAQNTSRPKLCRWNSFSNPSSSSPPSLSARSSRQFITDEESESKDDHDPTIATTTSKKATTSTTTNSLLVNACKPVRRGSWGSSDFIKSPTKSPR